MDSVYVLERLEVDLYQLSLVLILFFFFSFALR
jgi:hypothetical protein